MYHAQFLACLREEVLYGVYLFLNLVCLDPSIYLFES
jgi:hypothetical protein